MRMYKSNLFISLTLKMTSETTERTCNPWFQVLREASTRHLDTKVRVVPVVAKSEGERIQRESVK